MGGNGLPGMGWERKRKMVGNGGVEFEGGSVSLAKEGQGQQGRPRMLEWKESMVIEKGIVGVFEENEEGGGGGKND